MYTALSIIYSFFEEEPVEVGQYANRLMKALKARLSNLWLNPPPVH